MRAFLLSACLLAGCTSTDGASSTLARTEAGAPESGSPAGGAGGNAAAGCTKDTDCKGTRICENGRCVTPGEPDASVDASAGRGNGGNAGSPESGAGNVGGTISTGGAGASGRDASPGDARIEGGGPRDASSGGTKGADGAPADRDSGDASTSCAAALFIMQDRSPSMVTGFPTGSAQSWNNATLGITAFVQDPRSAAIDIGLGTFPVGNGSTTSCFDGADCGTPVVPISPLPGNAGAMTQAMQALLPQTIGSLSPTEGGLRGMINECLRFMAASPTGEPCVAVLVTDGGDANQCATGTQDLTNIVAAGRALGVVTYTLGMAGANLGFLDALASAGGTTRAIDVSAGSQAFDDALLSIRASAGSSCATACSSANKKTCGGTCVSPAPANGCSATSCTSCPAAAPANGVLSCNAGQCDFDCLSGYKKVGGECVSPYADAGTVSCLGQTCTNSCALAQCCVFGQGQCGCVQGTGACQ